MTLLKKTTTWSKFSLLTLPKTSSNTVMFGLGRQDTFVSTVLIANDDNVGLRNIGIKAVEQQLIKLSQDQREFHWGSNDRKLFTIPFDENPYSALAAWFKTDEGVEVFKTIEKKLQ